MSEIAGELARVREAFDKPTLRLLDRKWAPFVLAVFKSSFSRDRRSVPAERLHAQVDAYLADLRSIESEVPGRNGRALCVQWMNDQWLYRESGEGDEEQYSLTSHALEALLLVEGLSRDRALISESRLTTIVDTVRHRATQANPDRAERIRRLDQEIAEKQGERDRLAAGGEIAAVSNEAMHEGYANLVDLITALPSDFKRVEESVAGMHRQIVNDFRNEDRPIGEVLDEYLSKTDALMSSTPEGRAFEGAFTLLRNDSLLADLKNDLETILLHPFALELSAAERRGLMGTVGLIRKGIDDVLTQRNGLTTTLREHIVNHDVVKDRELERLLRDINRELATWMLTAGPRSTVTAELMPGTLEVEHLRERFYDPALHRPPPALEDVTDDAPAPPSLDELRQQGGPRLGEMRDALVSAFGRGGAASVGDAFNELAASMRRPVEILGMLQIATQVDAVHRAGTVETLETVRPDGSSRRFEVPRIILNDDETAALSALNYGPDDD
ncbi:hypothetical protein RCH16_001673 [Cryobacterium sp. MP_M5]|uniref:DUF3375 domain-containing protein n=1 Tax=unclassified Cryobacterium TaxID=2649013 RepID=UPI0018C9376B|nr:MULTISPECIES: DUF3375 domain-containing protein [unclassified Cryobacterium]MBG6058091.1 hypothetical protein [Cryobacterium sp. MP_M3]MEC5176665.1 hypothetical protein [Cryobacterium sp. MP_M5]